MGLLYFNEKKPSKCTEPYKHFTLQLKFSFAVRNNLLDMESKTLVILSLMVYILVCVEIYLF